jgi:four helix bundle protein
MAVSQGFRDLKVYQLAFNLAMEIFYQSKKFPIEEKYSLTDQIRRASRSVPGNIGEGYRKKRYPRMFVSKMADADGEATETQVWLDFAHELSVTNAAIGVEKRLRRGRKNVGRDDCSPGTIFSLNLPTALLLPLSYHPGAVVDPFSVGLPTRTIQRPL